MEAQEAFIQRVRGWGHIGNKHGNDAAKVQDAVGDMIAEALTQYWDTRPSGSEQPSGSELVENLKQAKKFLAELHGDKSFAHQYGHVRARDAHNAIDDCLTALQQPSGGVCKWKEQADGFVKTGCGEELYVEYGSEYTPNFCQCCGKQAIEDSRNG